VGNLIVYSFYRFKNQFKLQGNQLIYRRKVTYTTVDENEPLQKELSPQGFYGEIKRIKS